MIAEDPQDLKDVIEFFSINLNKYYDSMPSFTGHDKIILKNGSNTYMYFYLYLPCRNSLWKGLSAISFPFVRILTLYFPA